MLDGVEFGKEVVDLVRGYVEREVAPLKAENESLKARVAALEALPAPEKGEPGEKGADGSNGADGASVTVEDVAPLIAEQVAKSVAEIALPKDGVDGRDGIDGRDGADGRGVKELLIDRDGHLIATMDDGELKSLGPVIGKDGANGNDGAAGKDGRDGFGFDDMDVAVLDDDRTVEILFRRGDEEKAFTLKWPTVIDRGVFKAGETYQPGDGVTWGGSFWIAQRETGDKPDTPESGFRLAVKRGRDGKDAKVG